MIELYLLEQLYAVYKYETINQAAKELHLTQPTITRSMQKIEKEFGVPLFIRSKNKIAFNENGKLAAKYAERILHEQKEMIERVRSNASLSVAFCAPGPRYLLQSIFKDNNLGTIADLPLQNNDTLFEYLRKEKYNLIVSNEVQNDLDLYSKQLCVEHLSISVPPEHPYTKFQSLSFQKANGTTFVMAQDIGVWGTIVRTNMPDSKFLLQDSIDALSQIILFSSIPAFATDISSKFLHKNENRIYIPITDKNAECTFYLYCLRENKDMYQNIYSAISNKQKNNF